jgi:5-formyltetrahydrofolate cyclo-ligase
MEDINDKKREISNKIISKIEAFPDDILKQKQQAVEDRLFEFANFLEAGITLFYVTRGSEVATINIIKRALADGKKVALPLVDRVGNKTTIFKIDDPVKDMVKNDDNILEPDPKKCKALLLDQIDIAIVPGIAFDEKGGRIGIEDNFYDKFIAKLPITTRKVALAFEEQVVNVVPADSRNKHIDIIVTDKRTIYKI